MYILHFHIIHNIMYNNQSLRGSNTAVSETNNRSCKFTVIQNVSLPKHIYPLALVSLPEDQTDIVLLFNCNISSSPEKLLARTGLVTPVKLLARTGLVTVK